MGFEYPKKDSEYTRDLERVARIKESLDIDHYAFQKLRYHELSDFVLDLVRYIREDSQFIKVFKEAARTTNRLPSDFGEVEKQVEALDSIVDEYLTETSRELEAEFKRYENDRSYEAETRRKTLKHYYEEMKRLGLDREITCIEKYRYRPVTVKKARKKLRWVLPIIFVTSNIITAYVTNPDWFAYRLNDLRYYACYLLNATPNEKCQKDARKTEEKKGKYSDALKDLEDSLEMLREATE